MKRGWDKEREKVNVIKEKVHNIVNVDRVRKLFLTFKGPTEFFSQFLLANSCSCCLLPHSRTTLFFCVCVCVFFRSLLGIEWKFG